MCVHSIPTAVTDDRREGENEQKLSMLLNEIAINFQDCIRINAHKHTHTAQTLTIQNKALKP